MTNQLLEQYGKPVVMDEIAYEGNIQYGWGNITGEEMVRRFWETSLRGGFPGHGETFLNPDGVLWWSHGGVLHGESPARIEFMKQILSTAPGGYLVASSRCEWDEVRAEAAKDSGWMLCYYSFMRPSFREFRFDDSDDYRVDLTEFQWKEDF